MKDGYYLSTYLFINSLAYLTKKESRHDQSISLWKKEGADIKLIHYWELERVTGLKQHRRAFYSMEQAKEVINKLLETYNLSINDMVEIWGTPELDTSNDYHSVEENKALCYHSVCHLFSSLLMDTKLYQNENIIGLAVDGAPDNIIDLDIEKKNYYTGSYSQKGKIVDMFPIYSPGVLWGVAKEHYKLREGTLMALANASKSRLLNTKLKKYLIKNVNDMAEVIDDLFNLFDWIAGLKAEDVGKIFNEFDSNFSEKDNKISIAISEIQRCSIEIMEKNIDNIIEKYNINPEETYLAISGGYALNCPTNSHLMQKYKFKGFISTPFVSDAGLSMGIALYAFHKKMKGECFNFKFETPYYGNEDDALKNMLDKYKNYINSISELDYSIAIKDIEADPVVWFNGRSEVGPRALGNRSILADARNEKSKQLLNDIKQRQWWRPVAPMIMEEELDQWFEDAYPSPFMLHTFKIKKGKEKLVPAVAHLDNSARIQTVNSQTNLLIYNIMKKFKDTHQMPIICNTSLNDIEEPIIDTIEEAINFILRKKIKIGYINGHRVEFKNHEKFEETSPSKRRIEFDNYISEDKKRNLLKEMNPHNISDELLMTYVEHPRLYSKIDIRKEADIRLLEGVSKLRRSRFHML